MAKQRRMALLTAALGLQAAWLLAVGSGWGVLAAGLALIVVGSVVTCATRTLAIARELEAR